MCTNLKASLTVKDVPLCLGCHCYRLFQNMTEDTFYSFRGLKRQAIITYLLLLLLLKICIIIIHSSNFLAMPLSSECE